MACRGVQIARQLKDPDSVVARNVVGATPPAPPATATTRRTGSPPAPRPPAGAASTISYNAQGQMSNLTGPVNMTLCYNNAGQVSYEFGGLDFLTYNYDDDGRLTNVDTTTATYNANGQIATLQQTPPGNTTTFTYDDAGRVATAALARNATTTTTSYSWDADSNRTGVSATGLPAVTYHYNLADQLTTDSAGGSYSYDPDGNLTSTPTAQEGDTSRACRRAGRRPPWPRQPGANLTGIRNPAAVSAATGHSPRSAPTSPHTSPTSPIWPRRARQHMACTESDYLCHPTAGTNRQAKHKYSALSAISDRARHGCC
jgi:YD repeat-containing protein